MSSDKWEKLDREIQKLVDQRKMPGGALIVRKNGNEIYRGKWGFADVMKQIPAGYDTMYRIASMTKPITATAVMQLVEEGKIDLDDPIDKFLPEYKNPVVYAKYTDFYGNYEADEGFPKGMETPQLMQKIMSLPPVDVERKVTIRDLLSHFSGMGMSLCGYTMVSMMLDPSDKLEDRVKKWASIPLDFQPESRSGYSTVMGFDILGRIIEVVSQMDLAEYFRTKLFEPLGISNLTFLPDKRQAEREAENYHCENGKFYIEPDTDTAPISYVLIQETDARIAGYYSGSAGLWGSVEAYDRFTTMFANEGILNGARILKPETIRLMHTEAAAAHLVPAEYPGAVWGFGMMIYQEPDKMQMQVSPGTFGWSGAFGTHMFIDPQTGISATFVMNSYNAGGAASPIARMIEKLIYC